MSRMPKRIETYGTGAPSARGGPPRTPLAYPLGGERQAAGRRSGVRWLASVPSPLQAPLIPSPLVGEGEGGGYDGAGIALSYPPPSPSPTRGEGTRREGGGRPIRERT